MFGMLEHNSSKSYGVLTVEAFCVVLIGKASPRNLGSWVVLSKSIKHKKFQENFRAKFDGFILLHFCLNDFAETW